MPKETKANINSGAYSLRHSFGFSSEFQKKPFLENSPSSIAHNNDQQGDEEISAYHSFSYSFFNL
jgi:hypothetical protein